MKRARLNKSDHYRADHLIAKGIVCLVVIALGSIGIETGNPYVSLIPGTVVWFFGVNASGYLVETFAHHEHRHAKV